MPRLFEPGFFVEQKASCRSVFADNGNPTPGRNCYDSPAARDVGDAYQNG